MPDPRLLEDGAVVQLLVEPDDARDVEPLEEGRVLLHRQREDARPQLPPLLGRRAERGELAGHDPREVALLQLLEGLVGVDVELRVVVVLQRAGLGDAADAVQHEALEGAHAEAGVAERVQGRVAAQEGREGLLRRLLEHAHADAAGEERRVRPLVGVVAAVVHDRRPLSQQRKHAPAMLRDAGQIQGAEIREELLVDVRRVGADHGTAVQDGNLALRDLLGHAVPGELAGDEDP